MAPTPDRTARTWLKALRIGFLPVGAAIFAAMPVPILAGLDIRLAWPVVLAIFFGVGSHLLWWAYGTILNDYHDREMDRHHPFGDKVFTQGLFSDSEQRRMFWGFGLAAAVLEIPQAAFILAFGPGGAVDAAAFVLVILAGYVMATAYSAPPARTRSRFLGATYTLMLVFVIAFLRFCLLLGGLGFLVSNWAYVAGLCLFIYLSHGITSVSLKDIPDAFSDAKGGVRSVPLVCGFRPALRVSMLFLGLTMGAGAAMVWAGWVEWWFLVSYAGVVVYIYLYRDMSRWIGLIERDPGQWYRVPMRKTYHVLGYIVNWGVWIPLLMLSFHGGLLA
jgi:4-hydroxybenzoate polyprenyltransferase